jgi:hypothetical protein
MIAGHGTSVQRTTSCVFERFLFTLTKSHANVLRPRPQISTERVCSGIGERVAPEYVQSERIIPFWVGGTVLFSRPVPTDRYAVPNLRYVLLRYNFRFPILLYFKTVALESDFLILGRNDNVASSIQNSIFGRIGITNFKSSIITYKWPYMR